MSDKTAKAKARLEELRIELREERISWGELAELQDLAEYIDPDDVELLEPAGVPEFPDGEKLEWSVLRFVMKKEYKGERRWVETTEDMFHEMLNIVPPRAQTCWAFLMGEAWDSNADGKAIYEAYKADGNGRYFAKYMTVKEFEQELRYGKKV